MVFSRCYIILAIIPSALSGNCRLGECDEYHWLRGGAPPFLLHMLPHESQDRGWDIFILIIDGIAAATVGSVLNYLLLGLAPQLDRFYLHSFEILLACTVVFPGIGNVGYTLLEYRLGQRNMLGALFENLRWIPFLYVVLFISFSYWGCGHLLTDSIFPIRLVFIVCSSLAAWVSIYRPLCWHICSRTTCKLLACTSHDDTLPEFERLLIRRFLGHGDRRVKKSSFRRSGLRVRILVPRWTAPFADPT